MCAVVCLAVVVCCLCSSCCGVWYDHRVARRACALGLCISCASRVVFEERGEREGHPHSMRARCHLVAVVVPVDASEDASVLGSCGMHQSSDGGRSTDEGSD